MRLSHVLVAAAVAACVSALFVLAFEHPGDVQKSDKATAATGEALSDRWPRRDLTVMTPKQAADSRKIADRIAPPATAEPTPAATPETANAQPLTASGESDIATKAPEPATMPVSALRIRAARARATENAAGEETVVKGKTAGSAATLRAAGNQAVRTTANAAESAARTGVAKTSLAKTGVAKTSVAKTTVAKTSVAKTRSKAFARTRSAPSRTASKPGYYYEVSGGQGYAESRVRRACIPGLRMPQVCYYPQHTRRHFPVRADE
ncbi:MAG: hypothetical protein HXY30_16165 [Pseudorhodoplanes sp.]|nr:hypothetical protein [Pseudorhodoplanes sp.]